MKNTYLDIIKLYTENDMSLLQISEYLNENNIAVDINREDLFKRCAIIPTAEKSLNKTFVTEETEVMLDKMIIETMPESVDYLGKYIKKLEYENANELKAAIDSKKIYAYQRTELLKSATAKSNLYYKKKLNSMIISSAEYLMDEYRSNPIAAADKYNLDRNSLYRLIDKNFTLKNAHNTSISTKLILVKQYISSGIELLEYCKKANITTVQFSEMLNDINKEHSDVYNEVIQYIANRKRIREEYVTNKAKILSHYIINQINYNDESIKFTLLDYFTIMNDDPSEFATEVHKLGIRGAGALIDDFFGIKKSENLRVEGVFGLRIIPKVQINKDMALSSNDIINGKIVTREDVDYIFELLEDNNIPKYRNLYAIALSRHINGIPVLPLVEKGKVKQKNIVI